jgi:osmotically-inducible protein OsmY
MNRSDAQVRQDIEAELRWEPMLAGYDVAADVRDGVVTLEGSVGSFGRRIAAIRAAERVCGVRALVDRVEVVLPPWMERPDAQLANEAVVALLTDSRVPRGVVRVAVNGGWIELEGAVAWEFERRAAERAVRYLPGVRGITNAIVVRPAVATPLEVSERIREALRRTAEVDAARVSVAAEEGRVTLRGTVRSWAERADAERAAWRAPGVVEVLDQIAVAP